MMKRCVFVIVETVAYWQLVHIASFTMLGDEDVFDSVTWESPSSPAYEDHVAVSSGPGFRQSTVDSGDPHEPKWEGYLVTAVKDPIKELAETKDAYVSYAITARVGFFLPYSGSC